MIHTATGCLISKSPGVCGGEACIRTTRIPIWVLVRARQLGIAESQLLADYPSLTVADLRAAWEYYDLNAREVDDAIARNEAD